MILRRPLKRFSLGNCCFKITLVGDAIYFWCELRTFFSNQSKSHLPLSRLKLKCTFAIFDSTHFHSDKISSRPKRDFYFKYISCWKRDGLEFLMQDVFKSQSRYCYQGMSITCLRIVENCKTRCTNFVLWRPLACYRFCFIPKV